MCTSAHSYHSAISWDVCTKLNHLAQDPFELLSFVALTLARSLNHTNSTATQSCQIYVHQLEGPGRQKHETQMNTINELKTQIDQIESNIKKIKEA